MKPAFRIPLLAALAAVAACTTMPSGPGVMALPGSGKSFDQFQVDDNQCRQYANAQVGGSTPNQAASDSGVKSAALGTLIGAAAGAAINGGHGAAVGAGAGLAMGSLAGTGAADSSSSVLQQRYDYGYVQCMYARGHKVPVSGALTSREPTRATANIPPPPPGNPPPPPR